MSEVPSIDFDALTDTNLGDAFAEHSLAGDWIATRCFLPEAFSNVANEHLSLWPFEPSSTVRGLSVTAL
jgi:hypothetical protein